MNALVTCGVAFEMKYIKQLPEQRSGSAALFGSVIHEALEKWAPNREQDLFSLTKTAWLTCTEGTAVKSFLGEWQDIASEVVRAEHECKVAFEERTGKESKAIHMSGEWKKHPVKKKVDALMREWAPKLEAGSPWRFNEYDPLPKLYNESLVLAKRYQARYGHLPPSLYTEFAFDVEWRGFRLNGYIDSIELLLTRDTGELEGVGVIDYKSYAKPPAEHKDYRQLVMYDVAVRDLVGRGVLSLPEDVPIYVGVDYLRWTDSWKDEEGNPFPARRFWQLGEADHERLEREATAYAAVVDARAFLPAQKSQNPDFCSYPDNCCLRNTSAAGGCAELVEVSQ